MNFNRSDVNKNIKNKLNFFKPRREKMTNINQVHPQNTTFTEQMDVKLTFCVGDKHKSYTFDQNIYEKINTRTQKVIKIIKVSSSICGCSKSQISTK